jgi:TonB family protein
MESAPHPPGQDYIEPVESYPSNWSVRLVVLLVVAFAHGWVAHFLRFNQPPVLALKPLQTAVWAMHIEKRKRYPPEPVARGHLKQFQGNSSTHTNFVEGGNPSIISRKDRLAHSHLHPNQSARSQLHRQLEPTSRKQLAENGLLNQKPRPLPQNRCPYYPDIARFLGWEDKIIANVFVSKQGLTQKVILIKKSRYAEFNLSALNAMTKWRFQPALKDGLPVSAEVLVPLVFALQKHYKPDGSSLVCVSY